VPSPSTRLRRVKRADPATAPLTGTLGWPPFDIAWILIFYCRTVAIAGLIGQRIQGLMFLSAACLLGSGDHAAEQLGDVVPAS
jgi:hypothetical protein